MVLAERIPMYGLREAEVVEHHRHMSNLLRCQPLTAAQRQIPILAAFQPLAETADSIHQCPRIDTQMAHTVLPEQQVGIPVGFEVGIVALPIGVDLVLVRVDELPLRMTPPCLDDRGQRRRMQFVVVVEQGEPKQVLDIPREERTQKFLGLVLER